jgi:hypothetical protein
VCWALQDETCYDAYNTRFGELHGPVTFEPYRAAAATFKDAVLYPHIAGGFGRGGLVVTRLLQSLGRAPAAVAGVLGAGFCATLR